MITRDALNGLPKNGHRLKETLVGARAVILNKIAGYGDEVGRPFSFDDMSQHCLQRVIGDSTAQARPGIGEQVWVSYLQDPYCICCVCDRSVSPCDSQTITPSVSWRYRN